MQAYSCLPGLLDSALGGLGNLPEGHLLDGGVAAWGDLIGPRLRPRKCLYIFNIITDTDSSRHPLTCRICILFKFVLNICE